MSLLAVGLGGALGSMLRYLLSLLPSRTDFPLWTLAANLIGAAAIGFIAQYADQKGVSARFLLFWKTGLCGGFTTFSTFSLESVNLFQKGQTGTACLYILASLLLCFSGTFAGIYAGKHF